MLGREYKNSIDSTIETFMRKSMKTWLYTQKIGTVHKVYEYNNKPINNLYIPKITKDKMKTYLEKILRMETNKSPGDDRIWMDDMSCRWKQQTFKQNGEWINFTRTIP